MTPPLDRTEYWIRFVCAFMVFGILTVLFSLRFMDSFEWKYFVVALLISGLISMYAARVGDEAWHKLIHFFRWW